MQPIDWVIMILPLTICSCIAIYSRRYVHSVADFMAGGRLAGRYLVCTARAEQGADGVGYMGIFQIFLAAGFTLSWWHQIQVPLGLVLAISGFVIYRYRQTRSLTIGQFFEMRYSRRFRLFAGILGFLAGLVGFGMIPMLGARFLVTLTGLPQTVHPFNFEVPTALILASIFIIIAALTTSFGGQISVLLTDCAEGMFSQIFYTFVALALLVLFFSWSGATEALLARPPGHSMVNPFDTKENDTFNVWFVVMNLFLLAYRNISAQGSHAFNSSAASPHEARMGGILGKWRVFASTVMVFLLSLCALTYLNNPQSKASVDQALTLIQNPETRDQMRVPVALSQLLPTVVKGTLASICLMGVIASVGMHLHSWGSIFIQDVLLPLRKTPLSPQQHLLFLRLAVTGVAVWAFFFGAIFPMTKYVALWWTVTESIFVSGAAIAIIGGLYWSRGTAAGAWAGMLLGCSLAMTGFSYHIYTEQIVRRHCFYNLQHVAVAAGVCAIIAYTLTSLLTCRHPHNMDKLLRRGQYAVESEGGQSTPAAKPLSLFYRFITMGIDAQFTRSDRWITIGITCWSLTWFSVFVVGTGIYLFVHPWSDRAWANYWLVVCIAIPLVISVATTIWFTIGCIRDLRAFFRRLHEEQVNPEDDGTVTKAASEVVVVK